jgi:hypothetical protein
MREVCDVLKADPGFRVPLALTRLLCPGKHCQRPDLMTVQIAP